MSHLLPSEIWLTRILPRLEVSSLIAFSSVCKHWNVLGNDDLVWRDLAIADFHLVQPYHDSYKAFYVRLLDSAVYTWGENSRFRLGHAQGRIGRNSRIFHTAIPYKADCLSGQGMAAIASGPLNFHALDSKGNVWTLAKNPEKGNNILRLQIMRPILVSVQFPPSTEIVCLASGRSHSIALDRKRRAWHWNHGNCPKPIGIPDIKQVVANWSYSTLLTWSGKLFTVRKPRLDRLGYPVPQSPEPLEYNQININVFNTEEIYQMAGMEYFTLVMTTSGNLWQLSPTFEPVLLEEYSRPHSQNPTASERPILVAHQNTFAVHYFGSQMILLGRHKPGLPISPPTQIPLPSPISKLALGNRHCGALTHKGVLLTCGSYSQGALGQGYDDDFRDQPSFAPVKELEDMFVLDIGFGGMQSSCVAVPRH
ncbi:regulator of chromosome condensation 1/beta-lactamase-inhibitor protein II [Phycomyces nitens]|nr:regulator of chromosome condensation 1/beta-lactamase-inhibitor protein II [Phycomyces nitens]